MDACHLSLGKPWQYNRNVVHDKQHNMYTLSIKGKHIALAHRREMVAIKSKGKNILFLSQFMEYKKDSVENQNDLRKGIINKSLTSVYFI